MQGFPGVVKRTVHEAGKGAPVDSTHWRKGAEE
jgi:hypothetical protein